MRQLSTIGLLLFMLKKYYISITLISISSSMIPNPIYFILYTCLKYQSSKIIELSNAKLINFSSLLKLKFLK